MKETKLKKLFEATRREPVPTPRAGFAEEVLRAIHRERRPESTSVFDQLALLFPRLACATLVLIGCCVAGDWLSTGLNEPGLSESLTQLSDQWLLAGNGI